MAEALHCNFFEHDRFFSRIIAMIPSELYTHAVSEDNIDDLPNKYYQVTDAYLNLCFLFSV